VLSIGWSRQCADLIVAALLAVISIGFGRACGGDRRRPVSEFLEVLHAVFGEQVEGVPSLVIKLNALPSMALFPVAG